MRDEPDGAEYQQRSFGSSTAGAARGRSGMGSRGRPRTRANEVVACPAVRVSAREWGPSRVMKDTPVDGEEASTSTAAMMRRSLPPA